MEKIRLGISACLYGEKVRYDGGHKLDRFLVDTLGQYFDYVPVCPEVECGLPIPREPMCLWGDIESPRLMTIHSRQDMTDRMANWAKKRVLELEKENLYGFIFKSNSPSSGMERVKVYQEKGIPVRKGIGLFARIFMEYFPLLPVEEEGRLQNPRLRENFIERIFTLKRWRETLEKREGRKSLIKFHSENKLFILSHSPQYYQMMERVVAGGKEIPIKKLYQRYQAILMKALQTKTTSKKNVNVLQHILGYFKWQLSSDEKQELIEVIDDYRKESIPLIVPITLIRHYVWKYDQPYLKKQTYLNPHPLELQLRNHI